MFPSPSSRFSRLIWLFCLYLILQFAVIPTAEAESLPKTIMVPVFFVTDREEKKQTFGPNRKYVVHCKHDPYYGIVYCPIKNEGQKSLDSNLKELGWSNFTGKMRKKYGKAIIDPANATKAESTFFDMVRGRIDKTNNKELYVYIHGMNNSFEAAASKAARLAYNIEAPVILYSWPSVGGLSNYHIDEGNIEWSLEHFKMFVRNLAKYNVAATSKVTVIAHSIANRLLVWAASDFYGTQIFKQAILVSPDIDTETFKHYIMDYANQGTRILLLISHRDRALPLTQLMYGGYYRLGEGVDSFFSQFSDQDYMLNASTGLPESDINHENKLPADKAESSTDSYFRTIDYTEVDKGIIGHKFPFELIGNLCRTNQPGPGLKLVEEEAGRHNFLSRFMQWSFDLVPPPAGETGIVERVVKSN